MQDNGDVQGIEELGFLGLELPAGKPVKVEIEEEELELIHLAQANRTSDFNFVFLTA